MKTTDSLKSMFQAEDGRAPKVRMVLLPLSVLMLVGGLFFGLSPADIQKIPSEALAIFAMVGKVAAVLGIAGLGATGALASSKKKTSAGSDQNSSDGSATKVGLMLLAAGLLALSSFGTTACANGSSLLGNPGPQPTVQQLQHATPGQRLYMAKMAFGEALLVAYGVEAAPNTPAAVKDKIAEAADMGYAQLQQAQTFGPSTPAEVVTAAADALQAAANALSKASGPTTATTSH